MVLLRKKKDQITAFVASIDSFLIDNLQHIHEYTYLIYYLAFSGRVPDSLNMHT